MLARAAGAMPSAKPSFARLHGSAQIMYACMAQVCFSACGMCNAGEPWDHTESSTLK